MLAPGRRFGESSDHRGQGRSQYLNTVYRSKGKKVKVKVIDL